MRLPWPLAPVEADGGGLDIITQEAPVHCHAGAILASQAKESNSLWPLKRLARRVFSHKIAGMNRL